MIANNSCNEQNKGLMPNDKQQNDKEQQQRTRYPLEHAVHHIAAGHHAGHHPIGSHLKEHT